MNYKGMNSPVNHKGISNPFKNGEKVKRLKEHHTRQLEKNGLKLPRSPLK